MKRMPHVDITVKYHFTSLDAATYFMCEMYKSCTEKYGYEFAEFNVPDDYLAYFSSEDQRKIMSWTPIPYAQPMLTSEKCCLHLIDDEKETDE